MTLLLVSLTYDLAYSSLADCREIHPLKPPPVDSEELDYTRGIPGLGVEEYEDFLGDSFGRRLGLYPPEFDRLHGRCTLIKSRKEEQERKSKERKIYLSDSETAAKEVAHEKKCKELRGEWSNGEDDDDDDEYWEGSWKVVSSSAEIQRASTAPEWQAVSTSKGQKYSREELLDLRPASCQDNGPRFDASWSLAFNRFPDQANYHTYYTDGQVGNIKIAEKKVDGAWHMMRTVVTASTDKVLDRAADKALSYINRVVRRTAIAKLGDILVILDQSSSIEHIKEVVQGFASDREQMLVCTPEHTISCIDCGIEQLFILNLKSGDKKYLRPLVQAVCKRTFTEPLKIRVALDREDEEMAKWMKTILEEYHAKMDTPLLEVDERYGRLRRSGEEAVLTPNTASDGMGGRLAK